MIKTYEAMFLLDAGSSDFEAAAAPVREVLGRADAEVLSLKPWDDRRLAYDIKGRRRGLYVLTYFRADASRLSDLHHEIQLNEQILRALVLSADHVSEEKIHAETPATLLASRRAAADAQKSARAAAAEKAQAPARQAQSAPAQPQPVEEKASPEKAQLAEGAGEKPQPEPDQPKSPPDKAEQAREEDAKPQPEA